MKFRSLMTTICLLATASVVSAQPFAYVANSGTKTLSIIDTAITPSGDGSNAIVATVDLPAPDPNKQPYAYSVAVSPSGQYVYVGLQTANEIAVFDAAKHTLVKRIGLNLDVPGGLAVNAAETRLYVTSNLSNTLIVIDISNIKLGGSTVTEVGRPAVDTISVSNPEGVVLSPNGLKAYVANSGTGKIAVIDIDETNNTYTRSDLFTIGNNTKPMGLALNSTGTKLYVSGYYGTASVVDVATKAATDLTVGTGNLSVAVTPDNTRIYAPSAGYNNMSWIDGSSNAVTALGGQNSLQNSPWSAAVNPLGTKLYVTMNLSDNVRVFNPGTGDEITPAITLTTNANPTSFGDFVGPALPYTITASKGGTCAISPEGSIPVNAMGRRFAITGTCSVLIDGILESGTPSSYTFSNVTAGHTIHATNASFTLSGDWTSSVGGYLVSTPAGIDSTHKSFVFPENAKVVLAGGPGFKVQSGTWGPACTVVGDTCEIIMTSDKSYGTPDIIIGGGSFNIGGTWYQDWASASAAASANDLIKVTVDVSSLTTTGTAGLMVRMSNQWSHADANTKGNYAPMVLTITNVGVTVDPSDSIVL